MDYDYEAIAREIHKTCDGSAYIHNFDELRCVSILRAHFAPKAERGSCKDCTPEKKAVCNGAIAEAKPRECYPVEASPQAEPGQDAKALAEGYAANLIELEARYRAADAVLRQALVRIERWFGEFPESGSLWPDGTAMSYGAAFGSNGERDYMRGLARAALASSPAREDDKEEAK